MDAQSYTAGMISIHSAARAETRLQKTVLTSLSRISIHSAARAETGTGQVSIPSYCISIHSAARAETRYQRASIGKERNFNPLRREGGDPSSPIM